MIVNAKLFTGFFKSDTFTVKQILRYCSKFCAKRTYQRILRFYKNAVVFRNDPCGDVQYTNSNLDDFAHLPRWWLLLPTGSLKVYYYYSVCYVHRPAIFL